jgi:DUF4097 and DUF4098 domain-containing protein YvlB
MKVIPCADNKVIIEVENGDKFEIHEFDATLTIKSSNGDIEVSKLDTESRMYVKAMLEHSIRVENF